MAAPANATYVNGQGSVSGDQLNTFVQWCNTATDLQNFIGQPGMQVDLGGLSAVNDGGQGRFYWNSTGSANDGINNITPNGAAQGCWTRLTSVIPSLIPCTAAGSNTILLTPSTPISEYENGQLFGFIAAANSTADVDASVGSLAGLPVYTPSNVQAASGTFVASTFYILAYVSGYNSGNGGFAIVSSLPAAAFVPAVPQVTVYTGGESGNYVPPAGALYLEIEMVAAGGGGAGSGTTPGAATAGGNTTFGTGLTCNGGAAGVATASTTAAGGTATGGDVNVQGGFGGAASSASDYLTGGIGGGSFYGSGGPGGIGASTPTAGSNAVVPGSGGGGAGAYTTLNSGSGGGAGGWLSKIITSIAATYAYSVGNGGSGGTLGTNGAAGGSGANGLLRIVAHFQ